MKKQDTYEVEQFLADHGVWHDVANVKMSRKTLVQLLEQYASKRLHENQKTDKGIMKKLDLLQRSILSCDPRKEELAISDLRQQCEEIISDFEQKQIK